MSIKSELILVCPCFGVCPGHETGGGGADSTLQFRPRFFMKILHFCAMSHEGRTPSYKPKKLSSACATSVKMSYPVLSPFPPPMDRTEWEFWAEVLHVGLDTVSQLNVPRLMQ